MLTLATFQIPTGVRAWIEDVVVDGDARGSGVAAALVQAALDRSAELGARTVDLTSRPDREAANRLYLRMGFEIRQTNVYRRTLEAPAKRRLSFRPASGDDGGERTLDRATAPAGAGALLAGPVGSAFFVRVVVRAGRLLGWVVPPTKTIQASALRGDPTSVAGRRRCGVLRWASRRRRERCRRLAGCPSSQRSWVWWGSSTVRRRGVTASRSVSLCHRAVIPWRRSARPVRARPSSR